jgi:hypothetical protein
MWQFVPQRRDNFRRFSAERQSGRRPNDDFSSSKRKNFVDSFIYLPQYAGAWGLALLHVGLSIRQWAKSTLKGKIVHGGTFMATKKKAKKKKKH